MMPILLNGIPAQTMKTLMMLVQCCRSCSLEIAVIGQSGCTHSADVAQFFADEIDTVSQHDCDISMCRVLESTELSSYLTFTFLSFFCRL